ncbi:MAG TPA: S-methyl-5-thioribose-1-phosphate isomerase [Microscillaceae bacterium]|jgi:methylthioribose-1-phosphate isomerase|nr:S-methyl-5-thioribose-1-phosphate isomerase [Microscillaceae bacterium]
MNTPTTQRLRTIWLNEAHTIQVIDQRHLPHQMLVRDLTTTAEVVEAIKSMTVRGAPLIGATAALGLYLAAQEAAKAPDPEVYFATQVEALRQSRPTAVNLFWAIDRQLKGLQGLTAWADKATQLLQGALAIIEEDVEICRRIGAYGLPLLESIAKQKPQGQPVNILTHCNAGFLGCIEWGTATSPIYQAHQQGMPVHVWVDETRPRNQGANLTAWELSQAGVPHTLVVDNTGGHLMQHGLVDLAIVGTDRTTRQGDVANKIGTYLKALAAFDNQIPFYVALPSTSIDWNIRDGIREIPIEERNQDEVKWVQGWDGQQLTQVLITPSTTKAANFGFDVTPARLISGLITERGICQANEEAMLTLFPEMR